MPLRFHRLAPGCRVSITLRCGQLVNRERHWVWLVYSTFGRRLSGRTAVCLLIPAQGATWPTHPEVNWSLRERAAVPAAAPKIKLLPSASVAGADGGFRATETAWDVAPTGGQETPPPGGRWSFGIRSADQQAEFTNHPNLRSVLWSLPTSSDFQTLHLHIKQTLQIVLSIGQMSCS